MRTFTKQFKNVAMLTGFISVSLMATSPFVHAATTTSNLSVSATVQGFCTISDAALAFGNVASTGGQGSPTVTNVDGSTTITAMCNKGTVGTITANMGLNPDGTTIRRMASGAERLAYELYTDSARTTALRPETTTFTITGAGTSETKTIYGRIPGGSNINNAANGAYTDTVVLTVAYGL